MSKTVISIVSMINGQLLFFFIITAIIIIVFLFLLLSTSYEEMED